MKIVNYKNHQQNQRGLASIVIVTAIIAMLALITTSFAALMDREYHQATDRELASQANYAAESGMNDARSYVISQLNSGVPPNAIGNGTQCMDLSSNPAAPFLKDGRISGYYASPGSPSDNLVKYTCVIINPSPKDLTFGDIPKNQSVVFKLVPDGGVSVHSLYLSWDNTSSPQTIQSLGPSLPKQTSVDNASPQQIGMLRVTIYPAVNTSGSSDAQNAAVADVSRTYFLYANTDSSKNNFDNMQYSDTSSLHSGNCNTQNRDGSGLPDPQAAGYACTVVINNVASDVAAELPGGSNFSTKYYYVRITALYQDLKVGVESGGVVNGSFEPLKLDDAQAILDVTGEGNNVLKRLEGRLDLSASYDLPQYALQSMNTICKKQRLPEIAPNSFGSALLDPSESNPSGVDNACQL